MKAYKDLGSVHRGEPCLEYPGEWLLFLPLPHEGKTEHSFPTRQEALDAGVRITDKWESERVEYDPRKVSVGWKCSDNDPRQGQVWFTGFYVGWRMNMYGSYKET